MQTFEYNNNDYLSQMLLTVILRSWVNATYTYWNDILLQLRINLAEHIINPADFVSYWRNYRW